MSDIRGAGGAAPGGRSGRGAGHARHAQPRPATARAGLMMATKVLASALSLVLLLGFGYGWYEYRSLNNHIQRLHLSHLAAKGDNGAGGAPVKGEEQNILVVGIDSRSGLSPAERRLLSVGSDDSLSTDTIMVIHVPADGSKATLISIPRDSYVDIPGGYLKNKINAAYADAYSNSSGTDQQRQAAGANELVETVSQLTGLSINHYIQVGFGGFYTIAKAIGGITVDLCAATDDTLAYNETHGQGHVGSNFKMSAGKHELTPVQSLEFVRQRHNLRGGDLGREKRQRYFLAQAFNKIASLGVLFNPAKLNNLIDAISGSFYVDDNNFSLADLADQMANLKSGNIVGYTIPTQGSSMVDIAGVSESVELVDPAKIKASVAAFLAGKTGKTGKTGKKHPAGPGPGSGASRGGSTTGPAGATGTAQPRVDAGCIY